MTREEFMDIVYDELHSDGDNYRANRIIDAADEYAETEQELKNDKEISLDDAISRQAVQDYIAKYLSQYLYNDVREAVEVIDEYIGELPSVNPQPCEDAISRQAVLDVINLNWEYRRNCIRAIEKLPPVKQEPSSSENDLLQRLRKRISDLYNTDVTYDNGDYNTMDTPTLDKVLEYFDSIVNKSQSLVKDLVKESEGTDADS